MKVKLALAVFGCAILCLSIGYTARIAWNRAWASAEAWEHRRCWDKLGRDLEGKEFEIDTKKRMVKPMSTMTHEDLLKALYVYHWKHYQQGLRLEQIQGLAGPIEQDE